MFIDGRTKIFRSTKNTIFSEEGCLQNFYSRTLNLFKKDELNTQQLLFSGGKLFIRENTLLVEICQFL